MITRFFEKIYGRLATVLFIGFILVGIFSAVLFIRASRAYQHEISQTMHRGLAQHVASQYLLFNEDGKPNLAEAERTFRDLMILGPNFEFYLLDPKGKILAYSTNPENIQRSSINISPVRNFIGLETLDRPLYGDDPRSPSRRKIFSTAAIYSGDDLCGYLYVILGSEIYDDVSNVVAQSRMMQWGLWLFVIGLAFSLLATLWLTGVITRPLRLLTRQVTRIHEGGFDSRELKSGDTFRALEAWQNGSANEIHSLGSAFRDLLNKLQEQYHTVITIDELRRELLSHVSHDLRTPLASLLGYLETWEINRERISDEESAQYIATAKKSAQKISNLVEQLFELAYLDSDNVQVNKERFSIAELVQDVLLKFQIIALEQQIQLRVTPQDSSIKVLGDIEKLDRVLTNLIDNAIRHTKAGGSITVRLSPGSHSVAVEVADTGIGIPPQDIPHVFDPHYKAGNSVRGNTAHGGLGLAITKKLLALHQSTINVKSKVDEGTTFEFVLPAGT